MSDDMRDNEPDTKLVTVLEVRYKGNVIFSHQFTGVINEMDLMTETDLRNLPICVKCGKDAAWYDSIRDGKCKRCRDSDISDENAAIDQMYAIGYW